MNMFVKKIIKFFDKLEDVVRGHLSRFPILYGMLAGIGVVLFWRGVWHTADEYAFMTGPLTFVIGSIILLLTGAFVSSFIGNSLIITGLKGERKETEKTIEEVKKEETEIQRIERSLNKIEHEIEVIEEQIKK